MGGIEAERSRVGVTSTLLPGDIGIVTTDLACADMLVVVERDSVWAVADRKLTTVERHQALELARAWIGAHAPPPQHTVLIYRRPKKATGVASHAVTIDTKVEDGAEAATG